jgi:predicted RNA-binding protein with PUA-like domain
VGASVTIFEKPWLKIIITLMKYWLVKSEPFKYSWDDFLMDGWTYWDGVRNYQARNNLKSMKLGDPVLYYHSNEGLEVVGIAEVIKEAYKDPTTHDGRWVVVDLKPKETFKKPVSLSEIKTHKRLQDIALIKQTRLSVMPVSKKEFEIINSMGRGK